MRPPLAIVIKDRSVLATLMRVVIDSIPRIARDLVRGPAGAVTIDALRQVKVEMPRAFRPVDIVLEPSSALTLQIAVPADGRRDLHHAVALSIAERTPFEASEVLAHAAEQEPKHADGMRKYLVHLVPRTIVSTALADRGVRLSRVRWVLLEGCGSPGRRIDLQYSLFPRRRVLHALVLLPLLLLVGSAAWMAHAELSSRQRVAAALNSEIAAILGQLREMTTALDALRSQDAGVSQVRAALDASQSAFLMLSALRQALPTGTALQRIDLHDGELRLGVKSSGVLRDMTAFETDWSTSIEGAITTDPASGKELATVLLRPKSGGV